MRNFPRPFVTILLVISFLLSTVSVAAQGRINDWSKVTALSTGSNLAVKQKNGKTDKGTLSSTSDSALTVNTKNGTVEIKRDDVRTVHEVIKKSEGTKGALIGTAVGAGAGTALGVAGDLTDNSLEVKNGVVAGLAVVGAGIGALAGYFIGRSRSKRVLVYEAN